MRSHYIHCQEACLTYKYGFMANEYWLFVKFEADLAIKNSSSNTYSAMRRSTTSVLNLVWSSFRIRRACSHEALIEIGRQQWAPKGADASFRGCHTLCCIFSQRRTQRTPFRQPDWGSYTVSVAGSAILAGTFRFSKKLLKQPRSDLSALKWYR